MPNMYPAVLAFIAAAVAAPCAVAAKDGHHAIIKACSTSGHHGCITAPVRMTRLGAQYRTPGGSWIWCEHDCRDPLRRDTIDFWDDQRERSE